MTEVTNDPFDESSGGVENTIEVKVDYKSTGDGKCPTSTAVRKAAIQTQGETVCTNTGEELDATDLDCTAEVKNYSCKESGTADRKLSGGRNLEITYTETAVIELVIETYCATGDTAVECDPDSIEDLNDEVEAAVKKAIALDADLTFDELVADLVSDLKSWYPNWASSESKCKNDGKYPNYSKFHCLVLVGVLTPSLLLFTLFFLHSPSSLPITPQ